MLKKMPALPAGSNPALSNQTVGFVVQISTFQASKSTFPNETIEESEGCEIGSNTHFSKVQMNFGRAGVEKVPQQPLLIFKVDWGFLNSFSPFTFGL